jgi:hypothetical protein
MSVGSIDSVRLETLLFLDNEWNQARECDTFLFKSAQLRSRSLNTVLADSYLDSGKLRPLGTWAD